MSLNSFDVELRVHQVDVERKVQEFEKEEGKKKYNMDKRSFRIKCLFAGLD